jgi:hypothetical protein
MFENLAQLYPVILTNPLQGIIPAWYQYKYYHFSAVYQENNNAPEGALFSFQ